MNGMDEHQQRINERMRLPPPTLRELYLRNLYQFKDGSCTLGEALAAFDAALAVVRNREALSR